jgi:polygalacturonase
VLSRHQVRSETEPPARATPQQPYLHSDSGSTDASSSSSSTSSAPRTPAAAVAAAAVDALNSRNGGSTDSIQKLQRVLQLCDECGVIRQPVLLGGLLLVPLLSWHHKVCLRGLSASTFKLPAADQPASVCAALACLGTSTHNVKRGRREPPVYSWGVHACVLH